MKSVICSRRLRRLMQCGTALPLVALAIPAHAEPIIQQSAGDIAVDAESASGTPIAVELSSTGGSIDVVVDTVTGTAQAGVRDYIVGLETQTDGGITGSFGSITGTGEGELLGLGATTLDGNIALEVGTLDVDGAAAAGISARTTNGDVLVQAESVIARGTGQDSQFEFYEAVFGGSDTGTVTIDVGTAETHGTYGSAIVALAGDVASITADSATAHFENTVAVYASGANGASVDVGAIAETAENGQGAYVTSANGDASLTADTITVGDFAQGARVNAAAGNVDVAVGAITGGRGLYVDPTAGGVSVSVGTVDTYSYAVNAATNAGGNLTIDAGTVSSSNDDTATIIADAVGGGAIAIDVDQASGAGIDRATIYAHTDTGSISVTGGTVTASGDAGLGVYAHSTDGDVAVALDSVATTGLGAVNDHVSEGVLAESINGTASVTLGSASAEGFAASAAVALGGAGATVSVDEASVAGQQAAAIYASSSNGAAAVEAGTITLRGDQQAGVNAFGNGGTSTVSVDAIAGQGTLGAGVNASGTAGVSVASGTIDVERYGIRAVGLNDSSVTIATSGNTTSESAYALSGQGGDVSITTGEGTLTQGFSHGIRATATDSATIVNGGTAVATGDLGTAIHVTAPGAVSIASEAVEVTGAGADPGERGDGSGYRLEQGGIVVEGGDGAIAIDAGTVDVAGEFRYGIIARGNGAIAITADEVTLASADSGAVIARGGAGAVSIATGTVTTTGASGAGVLGTATTGNIVLDAGTTRVESEGLQGPFTGDAVVAISDSGNVSVTSDDAFSAGLYGSAVVGIGGEVTIDSGRAETTGDGGVAVYGTASTGNVTIAAAETVTSGNGVSSVYGRADAGDSTLTIGSLTATGDQAGGAFARADSGTASIATTGEVAVAGNYALRGQGAAVSIATGEGTTTSGTTGILVHSTGEVAIANGGAVIATGDLGSAVHVTAPGAVSITSNTVSVTGAGADPGVRGDGSNMRLEQGGIVVEGGDGAIAIDSGTVDVAGEFRYGITARGNGAIAISADDVTLASADSAAVIARGGAGDVSIATGTVTTTGASGVGVIGTATSGNIAIDAGTTRVENEGLAGMFTGDAVVAISDSGTVSVTSDDAFSAGLYGSAVVGLSDGNVSIASATAETTGDGGVAIYGESYANDVSIDAQTVSTSGDNTAALQAFADNGSVNVTVGDITTTGVNGHGVYAIGGSTNLTVDGTVNTTGLGALAYAIDDSHVTINGSVVSSGNGGVRSTATQGVVGVVEGATVSGSTVGVSLTGLAAGSVMELYNSGSIEGGTGPAVAGSGSNGGSSYIYNDGTLRSGGEFVVLTDIGNDTLELTNRSSVEGIANLGDGFDRLVLGFNDDASADALGVVAATVNVEALTVASGNWRADGGQSEYGLVDIDSGAILTIGENDAGDTAIFTDDFQLDGRLNLELTSDTEAGDLTGLFIEGSGSLHLTGSATVLVDDAIGLEHTGGTFVENGALLLTDVYGGDIATSGEGVFELAEGGDFSGNLVNDGSFVFSRAGDYSFLGDFSGSGLLEKQGDGTLTFAGLYAFEGTTSVLGGSVAFTGQLSEDTELDLEAGTVDLSQLEGGEQTVAELSGEGGELVLGDTQLIIEQFGDTVFAGSITGMGELLKDGEGELDLTGDGTGFTGTGQVDGGTLSVNGDYGSAGFVVNEGGTLGGAGTIGDTEVAGGTLAPGNSIGTLTVAGDVAFSATSVYEVEVDPAGNSDLIEATGAATLGGAAVEVIAESGTYRPLTDYTILTADGGVSGTFGSVETNLAFLDPSLAYSDTAVTLRLVRNDIDFGAMGETANQVAIGGLIEGLGFGDTLYDETLTLVDSDVAVSFASLTGEVYPAYGAALIETAEMLRRQSAESMTAEGTYAWATGLYNNVDGGNGAGGIELVGKGVAGGFGFGGNGFSASAGLGKLGQGDGGADFADGDVTFAIGQLAYDGPAGLSVGAGAQFGWADGETRRQTALGTVGGAVSGAIEGDYMQLFGEVAYGLPMGGMTVEPFVGVSRVSLKLDSVNETDAPTALAISAIERDVTFGDVGVRFSGDTGAAIRPFASAAYRRAWGDRASVATVGFAGSTGTVPIGAVPIAKSAAELAAGLAVTRGPVELEVGYEGTISNTFDSHGLNAAVKFRF